jgi:hypothetical protein
LSFSAVSPGCQGDLWYVSLRQERNVYSTRRIKKILGSFRSEMLCRS